MMAVNRRKPHLQAYRPGCCLQNVGRCWWCASPMSTQVGFVDVKEGFDAEGVTLTLSKLKNETGADHGSGQTSRARPGRVG